MAVDAKQTFGGRTASRRREILERVALVLAALLVVAGVVAYFDSRAKESSPAVTSPIQQEQTTSAPVVKPGGTLEPAARSVAIEFIRTTLGREDLARAWNLATPELRSGVTKKQWLRGELPIPPFPVKGGLETTGFQVLGSAPGEILLEVLLVPKPGSEYVPTRYELTLVRKGSKGPWKVSYFLPYEPPGIYAEPQ